MKRSTVLVFLVALGAVVLSASCSKSEGAAASGGAASSGGGSARSARARTPNPRTDFAYELNETGDGVVITRYVGTGSTTVVIPDTIEDYPVVGIGDDVFNDVSTGVDSGHRYWNSNSYSWVGVDKPFDYIYVPRTVTRVGNNAFRGPYYTIEDDTTYSRAIQELDIDIANLTSVTPYTLAPSGSDYAGSDYGRNFRNAKFTNTDITIPAGWETNYYYYNGYYDINYVFVDIFGGTNVTSVTFSDGWEAIPAYMFSGCPELRSVTIPASVKEIYSGAFQNCPKLEEVNFAEGASIKYVFAATDGLINNLFGDVNDNSFEGCTALPLAVKAKIQATGYAGKF